jgi:tRNA(Ile)-lysidine synthase
MSRQQPLPRRVLRFIREHNLVSENELLLVGVSGGPDSVCLIHILAGLKNTLGIELHIAHLNHMLRGAESDADADYVASLARELGIPATIEKREVKTYQKKYRLSLEEAAREVRYTFFAEVARSLGADMVAVGHTADDQIETILMHLVRGTGLAGLRGMQPLSTLRSPDAAELKVVRPLLEVKREETVIYCAARGLAPRSDSSNLLPNQLRNKIRSQFIPLLRGYNPDIDEALLRMASAANSDLAYIDKDVLRVWRKVAKEQPDGIAIDRAEFSKLHPALRRHLVRSVLQHLLEDLRDIESVHIESLLEALAKPAGKKLSLPRGLAFHGDYSYGLLTAQDRPAGSLPALEGEHCLNIPGETELCGWRVRSSILSRRPEKGNEKELKACFDLGVTGKELTVRRRRSGDRFQPLGMESPKKLQDFMVDARIPRAWRDRVPLVCSPQHIIWVVGCRIDHRARVTPLTKRVLCLEFERIEPV